MTNLKKLFGEYKMTWPKVIIFAVITAVITAVLNLIPALNDTSFQDIAVSFECWILFAIFIIVNCDKWWEASLKCFVFFLISQPLIYLIEVPFSPMGWELFGYYGYWFKLTVLTLPGAAVAFLVKKKNWLSVAVLSVATGFLAYLCAYYFRSVAAAFPHHLLSCIFCIALAIFLVLVLLDEKKHRVVALIIIVLVLAVAIGWTFMNNSGGSSYDMYLPEGTWVSFGDYTDIVTVDITDGNYVKITSAHNGACIIDFTNEKGEVVSYNIVVDGANLMVSPVD